MTGPMEVKIRRSEILGVEFWEAYVEGDAEPIAQFFRTDAEKHARRFAAAPDLYAALKANEWIEDDGIPWCPSCLHSPARYEGGDGHAHDCALAAALAKAEGGQG